MNQAPDPQRPILPGGVIGILGGGQLGRMLAIAARRMGYRIHVLDPTEDCPTAHLADAQAVADYADVDAVRRFARGVDVVTYEFENVPAESLDAIAALKPIRPGADVLRVCRHRVDEKQFLTGHDVPVAPFAACRSAQDVRDAVQSVGLPGILKTAEFGYDGKGQARLHHADDAEAAWKQLGTDLAVYEGFVTFTKEISVVAARTADDEVVCFDPAENDHEHGILDVSTVPAGIDDATRQAATDLAARVLRAIRCVGVLAVEMFVVEGEAGDASLVVNELAPRPHNSGHHTFDACVTSQFEQQLRAVCGLPLGDPALTRPAAAMANLLGDLWFPGGGEDPQAPPVEPDWAEVLAMPDVKLHLYDKAQPRPGRKMGHLVALAQSPEQARRRVLTARALLSGPGSADPSQR